MNTLYQGGAAILEILQPCVRETNQSDKRARRCDLLRLQSTWDIRKLHKIQKEVQNHKVQTCYGNRTYPQLHDNEVQTC